MTNPQKIVVIGAGIVGASTAIWLTRAGHDVTLIDRDGPGAGASFGNAGLLAQWAIIPVNTPGIARTGMKYALSRNEPLFLQWSHLPRMLPWLRQFLANASDTKARRTTEALIPLLTDSVDQHQSLTRGTAAAKWIATSDFVYAYETRAAFDHDSYGWDLRREAGMVPEVIEGAAVREVEPMLGPTVNCLAMIRDHGHILNPGAYVADLVEVLQAEGGRYLQAELTDVTLTDGRVSEVQTDRGPLPCDRAVLTAGIWSRGVLRKLGLKVPLEAERGYHLQFINPSQKPRNPMMVTRGKFGATPMECGFRCAGTVELGDIEKGPSRAPLDLIGRNVKRAFPDLTYERVEEWMGFRPSTPDSLPLIGEIGGTGLFAGFGHQHVGLTAGPKTGRLIADMISGQRPNLDLTPYDANRF